MQYNSSENNKMHKILYLPITRILIGIIVCILVMALGQLSIQKLLEFTTISADLKNLIQGIVAALLVLCSYYYLYKYYEKRQITELSLDGMGKNLSLGIILGAILQSLTILVIYLKGSYAIIAINPIIYLIPPLTMAFTSAIIEEVLLRGIVFRITEQGLGSYIALIISAIIFGALHLANPNSSIVVAIGLAIQAGLLLGAAYIYSRSLWLPIGLHFSWNFMQSAIFGANVSGNKIEKTLITANIEGVEWLTGGQFGPEGSIQATLFCLIATVILLALSHKQGKLIKPYWENKKQPNPQP